jgi:glc operon protein GlcG
MEGGLPILLNGQCVGSVGVSGVRSDQDAQVARAGVTSITGVETLAMGKARL